VQLNNNIMTSEQALQILAQIANQHLCNKQDRVVIDQALTILSQLIANQEAK
jgi:hypothetical protein